MSERASEASERVSELARSRVAHPRSRHSKSLTSSPARAGLALDPIQRLPRTCWSRFWAPDQNDRRYGNALATWWPGLLATRIPARPLSPEARSCTPGAVRGGVMWHGTPPPHPPGGVGWWCTLPQDPSPSRSMAYRTGLWAQGPRGARVGGEYRDTREYTGIRGYTPYVREHREYTGIRGIPGIPGIPGIQGIP